MMRPEEAVGLRREHCVVPDEGWGRLTLATTKPAAGRAWTDSGDVHDDRGLKHRSRKATYLVPIPPELVRLLRGHIERYGVGPDGHLFRSVNDNPIHPSTYYRVWKRARLPGMPAEAQPTPLLSTPWLIGPVGMTLAVARGENPRSPET